MKRSLFSILAILVVLSMVVVACGPTAEPTAPPEAPTQETKPPEGIKIVVIGKSVHPYWSNVEKGVIAAGEDLGVETVFFVPPKEDVAAQTQTMETYIAQGVTGIAIAPSDPNALESVMIKAADAGIFVTTLDTPPVENSVSLVYIGTNNYTAGKIAGETMAGLLPGGGKVGIGRGSDTALNALQRTDGFLEGIAGTAIEALEPVNDKEDAATALQLANSVISANPELAGAFGVYAYNGPAWATAIKEAGQVGAIKLVCFDATTDIINGIKEGVIDATVAQREYDMGYKSVEIIKLMAEKGTDAALSEMGAVDGVIDTGVDVITAATLKDYEAGLDAKGIPHEWNTEGWEPPEAGAPAGKRSLSISFAWPTYIDPAVGSDYSSTSALANLYDSLVFPNTDGGVDPHLAESWDTSEDGLTWTFNLKQGVKFHNGSELTASDVAWSMNRILEIGEGLAYVFLGTVESATALDDYTVEFKLTQPSGIFLTSLIRLYVLDEDEVMANIVTPGPYGDKGDYGKEWLLTHDAGSGPYKVKEFPLEEYLLMEKNEDWLGEFVENAPDEVRFIATTEPATVRTMMSRQELEISDQWQTVEALEALDELEGVDVAAFPVLNEFYYMIHNKKPPTDDIHFRRAMAYAFDYEAAVALEWPGTQQSRGPVPAITAGHNPDVFVFQRDLEKAREELALSAYADQLDDYPVEVHWITEVPAEEKWALLFQANMAEIGIKVDIVGTPWMSVVEETADIDASPHIVTIYVSADFPEAGSLIKVRYHSDAAATWSQNEWLLDEELDAKIDDALLTVDQEERYAKYRALQDEIVELCPTIFLYDQVQKHAYQSAYVDWPAARGEVIPVMGYHLFVPGIAVTGP